MRRIAQTNSPITVTAAGLLLGCACLSCGFLEYGENHVSGSTVTSQSASDSVSEVAFRKLVADCEEAPGRDPAQDAWDLDQLDQIASKMLGALNQPEGPRLVGAARGYGIVMLSFAMSEGSGSGPKPFSLVLPDDASGCAGWILDSFPKITIVDARSAESAETRQTEGTPAAQTASGANDKPSYQMRPPNISSDLLGLIRKPLREAMDEGRLVYDVDVEIKPANETNTVNKPVKVAAGVDVIRVAIHDTLRLGSQNPPEVNEIFEVYVSPDKTETDKVRLTFKAMLSHPRGGQYEGGPYERIIALPHQ